MPGGNHSPELPLDASQCSFKGVDIVAMASFSQSSVCAIRRHGAGVRRPGRVSCSAWTATTSHGGPTGTPTSSCQRSMKGRSGQPWLLDSLFQFEPVRRPLYLHEVLDAHTAIYLDRLGFAIVLLQLIYHCRNRTDLNPSHSDVPTSETQCYRCIVDTL